jgi:hypothetical protein
MPRIVATVSDKAYAKIARMKKIDSFEGKDWGAWLTFKARDVKPPNISEEATKKNMLPMWCSSFGHNMQDILKGETLSQLVPENPEVVPKGPCVVVGAGPSIWVHKHLDILADAIKSGRYKGVVCSSDRMLKPLLERGVVPDLTGSVDGSELIVDWYNGELVRKYGSQIKTCLNSSVSPNVAKACRKNKVHVYWFNALHDELIQSDSFSRLQFFMTRSPQNPNGLVSMSCGGNVGFTMWTIAHSILRRSPIALIGIDMGYPEGTPFETTPYFSAYMQAASRFGSERSDLACSAYRKVYNPYFKKYAYMDDVFKDYRATWLASLQQLPSYVKVFNCSEEGTLFGPGITCMPFKQFLEKNEA